MTTRTAPSDAALRSSGGAGRLGRAEEWTAQGSVRRSARWPLPDRAVSAGNTPCRRPSARRKGRVSYSSLKTQTRILLEKRMTIVSSGAEFRPRWCAKGRRLPDLLERDALVRR